MRLRVKKLGRYQEKRRFDATPEPVGRVESSPVARRDGGLFIIQKHRATRLHYDLRLELDGVLVSWAVPKGPSLDPAQKRLAVHVEDHPLEYQDFEGVIPEGNYGAGEVIVWDRGTWEWAPTKDKAHFKGAKEAIEKGKLDIEIQSAKLQGRFVLVRTKDEKTWLFFKVRDAHAKPGSDVTRDRPESVLTGRTIEEIKTGAEGEPRWSSKTGLEVPAAHPLPDLDALLGKQARLAKHEDFPEDLRPMRATARKTLPKKGEWLAELGLEGERVLARKRAGEVLPGLEAFPEIERAVARLAARDVVLDGVVARLDDSGRSRSELLAPRLAAQGQARERLAREAPAVYFAFDLLHLEGRSLRDLPIESRKGVLQELLAAGDERLRYLSHVSEHLGEFQELASGSGVQAIVLKKLGSSYEPEASRSWLEVTRGRGRRT
jgi:bifunctional non-homologous end joining protein LigD